MINLLKIVVCKIIRIYKGFENNLLCKDVSRKKNIVQDIKEMRINRWIVEEGIIYKDF